MTDEARKVRETIVGVVGLTEHITMDLTVAAFVSHAWNVVADEFTDKHPIIGTILTTACSYVVSNAIVQSDVFDDIIETSSNNIASRIMEMACKD